MKPFHHLALALSLFAFACQSTSPNIVEVDAGKRDALLSAVTKLEGRWQAPTPDGEMKYTDFAITSAGSAVQETMMPGEETEMINMYTLDGNSLVMTHYCAGGNQPRMRASSVSADRIEFHPDGVADLKPDDEYYMGAMTLVFIDDHRIEQRWRALKEGEEDQELVFEMTRVR